MSKFEKREIVVDGETIVVDVNGDMPIVDVHDDMCNVSALMAYWGAIFGAAEREKESVDSFYRRWRAQRTNEILLADNKLAEYKVKSAIEADDEFLKFKDASSRCTEACVTAKSVFESLGRKANLLQSMGARIRTELEAGRKVVTKMKPRSVIPVAEPELDDEEALDTATPSDHEESDGDSPSAARAKLKRLQERKKK